MNIETRAAAADESELVFRIKKQSLGPFIEQLWGWHEQYQRAVHEEDWQNRPWTIICQDGIPVGSLSIDRRKKDIRLSGFYLLPERQKQGIGSQVLNEVMHWCDRDRRDCRIALRRGNRALSLFNRHGFREVEADATHIQLLRNWRFP